MTQDFETAAHRLADVLQQENDALTRVDYASAVALLPAKEAALLDLARQQPKAADARAAVKGRLVELQHRLAGLAGENKVLLQRAITVQTRILRIVASAAAPPAERVEYSARGTRAAPRRCGGPVHQRLTAGQRPRTRLVIGIVPAQIHTRL